MTVHAYQRIDIDSGPVAGWCPGWLFATCFAILSSIKLVLVANREIVGAYRPYDEYWHIQAALHWIWGRLFNEMTLVHLPTYAAYLAASGAIGVPLRISTEIVYLSCAALLALSLGRLRAGRALQLVVFALLAFHPYIYEGFDFALPEMLYTCLMLAFVGLFIRVVVPVSRSDLLLNAMLFAVTAAFMWHLRKESILIGGLFGLITLAIAAALILKFITRRDAFGLTGRLVACPLLGVILLGMTISAGNGLRYGLWDTDQLSAPNYVRMFSSLLAIRPDHLIRRVSVTREAREKAYGVSPAFRELQPFLDGDTASITRTLGVGGGEIGAGWLPWTLIEAVTAAGHFGTPSDAEAFYNRVANEIDAALKDGRLPYRRAWLSDVDPVRVWLPYLPASTKMLSKSLFPSNSPRYPDRIESTAADVSTIYDRVTRRRTALGPPQFRAQGWVVSSHGRPLKVQIIDKDDEDISSHFEPVRRSDVKPIVSQDFRPGPDPLGFDVSWPTAGSRSVRLRVVLEDFKVATSEPIDKVPLGTVIKLPFSEPDAQVVVAVDRVDRPLPAKRTTIVTTLSAIYLLAIGLFSMIGLIYIVYHLGRGDVAFGVQGFILAFVLSIVSSRVLFLAILDASMWSTEPTQYLLPAAVLIPIVPAIFFTFSRRSRQDGCTPYYGFACPDVGTARRQKFSKKHKLVALGFTLLGFGIVSGAAFAAARSIIVSGY